MKFKFLAAATALAASVSAAGAADLNKPAAVAVDYVKVCSAYGYGFFYIPGSDTCLKVGGRVYADQRYGSGTYQREGDGNNPFGNKLGSYGPRGGNAYLSRSALYLNLDARMNTDFGLLRSYEDIRLRYSTGTSAAGSSTELDLDLGYIQWGGLTVGHTRSPFDFIPNGAPTTEFGDEDPFQTNTIANLMSYTFTFGNGVTGTVGIIDSAAVDSTYNNLLRDMTDTSAGTDTYGGDKVPDVVANLNVTQAWGSAQVAAAYHQDYSLTFGSKSGYAVMGGISINLPTLGKTDAISLTAGFGSGAEGYLTAGPQGPGAIGVAFAPGAGSYIGQDWAVVGGTMHLTQTWGAIASFRHDFNPNFQMLLDANFLNSNGYGARDFNAYGFDGELKWLPTANPLFYIAVEAEYGGLNYTSATKAAFAGTKFGSQVVAGGLSNVSGYEVGLRVNRGF